MSNWQKVLQELNLFIENNSSIVLTKKIVSIPELLREEFYAIFDRLTIEYCNELYPSVFTEIANTQTNYRDAEKELLNNPAVSNINMKPDTYRYLHEEYGGMSQIVWELLFELLKNEIDVEDFLVLGEQRIQERHLSESQNVYENLGLINIINWLNPSAIYHVPLPKLGQKHYSFPVKTIQLTEIEKTGVVNLAYIESPIIRTPDFIVDSSRFEISFAFTSSLGITQACAKEISKNCNNLISRNLIPNFKNKGWLIHVARKPEELSVIADAKHFAVPKLMVTFIPNSNKDTDSKFLEVMEIAEAVQPYNGLKVFSGESVSHYLSRVEQSKLLHNLLFKQPPLAYE
jgi:hypothetical protein